MTFRPLRSAVVATLALAPVAVPSSAQQLEWGAEVRSRFESRDVDGARSQSFTGMRTRLELARALNPDARVYLQLQDARLWGEELSTTDGSADVFDIHQAYAEFGHRGSSPLWLRAGRQEMEFAEGRLVGIPAWSYVSRSFDGVRAAVKVGSGVVDLFGVQLQEASSEVHDRDDTFYGAWGDFPLAGQSVQPFVLHDRQGVDGGTKRTTAGLYLVGEAGIMTWRVEGALQRGELVGEDIDASLFAARLTAPILEGRGDVGLWYDRYSGDAEALSTSGQPTGAFSDLFGRNHRFLGFADLFARIPAQTRGRGIQDVQLRFNWNELFGADGTLSLDLHRFLATDDAGLANGTFADEIDLVYRTPAGSGVEILGGASWVRAGDGGIETGVVANDQFFLYLQVSAGF